MVLIVHEISSIKMEAKNVQFLCLLRIPSTVVQDNEVCKFGYHLAVPTEQLEKTSAENGEEIDHVEHIQRSVQRASSTPHVIAMVGLPARGKTYISKKLSRYLNWIGINTKVFNLGDYRRKEAVKAKENVYTNHCVFDPENKEGRAMRERVCHLGLEDVLSWLDNDNGEVAIFDATNTTRDRRSFLYNRVVVEKGYKLFFIESLCDDKTIVDSNIKEVKVTSPDYVTYDKDKVYDDFMERIKHYESQYQSLDEELEPNFSFLKIFNAGSKFTVHKHEGHIQSRIVYYLMNVKITPRTIYLTRHGESYNNITGKIGGDSSLSARGEEFSRQLAEYIEEVVKEHPNLLVWTSWMKRTISTAKYIPLVQERWKALNEIDSGVCDDLTYEEIKNQWPQDFRARDVDKFRYRYPRGESYEDLISRLEPVIMELERQDCVMIVGHQAVNRCLLGYFLEVSEEDLPWQEVPLHSVIKLSPKAYGCQSELIRFDVASVSTHRPKPDVPGQLEKRFLNGVQIANRRASLQTEYSNPMLLKQQLRIENERKISYS